MRRYKYIGHNGSSGYRTGKKYWGGFYLLGKGLSGICWFSPLNHNRKIIHYTSIERFKADWE